MFTRISRFFALAMLLVFATTFGFSATQQTTIQAQDDMMMKHTCDSTLILLLYIAEYDYGFKSMLDVSTFEKGQYAAWFDAMMMMDDMMDDDMDMMDDDMDMMDDDMDMMDNMMMLAPAVIDGEDEACTALRAEIEAYLYKTISKDMMMMESEG